LACGERTKTKKTRINIRDKPNANAKPTTRKTIFWLLFKALDAVFVVVVVVVIVLVVVSLAVVAALIFLVVVKVEMR
jgi:Flp pilus assembly protein TadB